MENEKSISAHSEVAAPTIPAKTWVYLIIYMVVLTAFITLETQFLPAAWGSGGINIGPSGGFLVAMALPYVFSCIMLLIMDRRSIKIQKSTFALFYLATMIATWFSTFKGFATTPNALFNIRVADSSTFGYALPSFWLPSADAIRGCYYGGSLNNLFVTYASEWMPVIGTYIYWYIVSIAFFLGVAIVMRSLWVDIEVLPFPHAQGWVTGEMALAANEKKPDKRKRVFLITALLGLIFYIPYMIYSANPGLPDFYGWLKNPQFTSWATGNFEVTSAYPSVASSIAGIITFQTDPLKYAFFFLAPLDTLMSMTVAGLGFTIILPQILTYFGYYSGIYTSGIWGKQGMIYFGDPLWVDTISAGLGFGILVFMILFNWKYFAGTIKKAVSGGTPSTEVSYTLAYLLVIVGGIGLAALFVASSVSIDDAIMGVLIILIQLIVLTRARAYSGNIIFMTGINYTKMAWSLEGYGTMPAMPAFPAGKLFIDTHVQRWGTGCDTFGPYYSTMIGTMDGFKIGSMAGLRTSSVFYLCAIGAILGTIVVIPLTFVLWHAFGYTSLPINKEWDYFWDGANGTYNGRQPLLFVWQGWFGFLLSGLLLFLRMRYVWWPLEPIGFFLGTTNLAPWHISVFTPLIVWAVKYTLIKVGGRKAYDEVGIPAAFGIITGEMGGLIIVSLINMGRFFVFR